MLKSLPAALKKDEYVTEIKGGQCSPCRRRGSGDQKLDGSHAMIDGSRGQYSIHLGSGVIHQLGGPQIQVLPVHSQQRGKLFLPFMDEDPKTAEIMSKVVLFARDEKIKNPYILSQIG
ncbi:MAG: hypothetical protein ACRDBO_21835 [Lachnospiraceae bacterium]